MRNISAFTVTFFLLMSALTLNTTFAQETPQFTVQVATSSSQPSATSKVAELKEKGLSAFYTAFENPEGATIYRINVGHLDSRERAQKFRKTLITKYQLSAESFVRLLDSETTQADGPSKIVFKIKSENLPTPTPVPSPTPSPPPIGAAAAAPLAAQCPCPTPSEISLPPPAAATPLPTAPLAPEMVVAPMGAPDRKTHSSFSLTVGALVASSNYTLNLPAGYGTTGLQNTLTSSAGVGTGFGLLPALSVSSVIDLQTGLLVFQRTFNVTYNNGLAPEPGTESYMAVEVPLLIFFNLSRSLAFGIGGYVVTNPSGSITQSTFGGPTMPDANLTGADWGLTGAIKATLPLDRNLNLTLSAMYNDGNGNFSPASTTPIQAFTDYEFLVGFQFYLGHSN